MNQLLVIAAKLQYLCDSPFHYKQNAAVTDSLIKAGVELGQKGIISSKLIRQIEKKVNTKEFNLLANKYWDDVVEKNKVVSEELVGSIRL
jgi:hypothetical protein